MLKLLQIFVSIFIFNFIELIFNFTLSFSPGGTTGFVAAAAAGAGPWVELTEVGPWVELAEVTPWVALEEVEWVVSEEAASWVALEEVPSWVASTEAGTFEF